MATNLRLLKDNIVNKDNDHIDVMHDDLLKKKGLVQDNEQALELLAKVATSLTKPTYNNLTTNERDKIKSMTIEEIMEIKYPRKYDSFFRKTGSIPGQRHVNRIFSEVSVFLV